MAELRIGPPTWELPEPDILREFPDPVREAFGEAARFSEETRRRLQGMVDAGGAAGRRASDKLREDAERQRRDAARLRETLDRSIRDELERAPPPEIPTVGGLDRQVLLAIEHQVAGAEVESRRRQEEIRDGLMSLQEQARTRSAETTDRIVGAIEGASATSSGVLDDLSSRIERGAAVQATATRGVLQELPDVITMAIAIPLAEASRESARSTARAVQSVERQVSAAAQVTRRMASRITAGIAEQTVRSEEASRSMLERLGGLGMAFGTGMVGLGVEIGGKLAELGEGVLGVQWSSLLALLGLGPEEASEAMSGRVSEILAQMDPDSDLAAREWHRMSGALPDNPVLQALLQAIILVLAAPRVLWDLAGLRSKRIAQEYNLSNPTELMPVPDLIDAWRRDLLSRTSMLDGIRRQGYSTADAGVLAAMRRAVAPPDRLIEWWLLGTLPDGELESELRAAGVDAGDIERYRSAATPPPPIGDLISFAVREVFNPVLREQLDLDSEYPDRLTELGRKRGLSEEWARDYWAAHWELPGIGQGMEMFHRRELDAEGLDGLLRARDVAPVWRDKLTAIAYHPLSRVDLRRMYAMGEMTEAELTDGYLDLGYSPVNAGRLSRFAVIERRKQRAEFEGEYTGLTPSQLREAVHDGLLDRPEVRRELEARGYSPRAADIFLALTGQGTPSETP